MINQLAATRQKLTILTTLAILLFTITSGCASFMRGYNQAEFFEQYNPDPVVAEAVKNNDVLNKRMNTIQVSAAWGKPNDIKRYTVDGSNGQWMEYIWQSSTGKVKATATFNPNAILQSYYCDAGFCQQSKQYNYKTYCELEPDYCYDPRTFNNDIE